MVCLMESNPEVREQIQNLADKLGTEYDIAKIILQENNGYDLDKAPNGAESKLYKDLLDSFNGDERQALIAKAKTYLQPFFNWFGNWTGDDKTNVSKVVDENGEPLVVYHGTDQYGFTIFDPRMSDDKISLFASSSKGIASTYTKFMPIMNEVIRQKLIDSNAKQLIENEQWDEVSRIIRNIYGFNPFFDVDSESDYYNQEEQDLAKYIRDNNLSLEEAKIAFYELWDLRDKGYKKGAYSIRNFNGVIKIYNNFQHDYQGRFVEEGVIFKGSKEELIEALNIQSKIYSLYLNIKNPLVVDNRNEYGNSLFWNNLQFETKDGKLLNTTRSISKYAKENGYDGVIFKAISDYGPYPNKYSKLTDIDIYNMTVHQGEDSFDEAGYTKSDIFISFNSNQIKSATGNTGEFSTTNNDIRYKKSDTTYHKEVEGRLDTIGEFTNTQQLVDYILTLDNVDSELKKLLQVLRQESTRLVIEEFQPEDAVAAYAGYVKLYAPRVNSASNQKFAEDVAHELLHHYLQQYYDTNPEFRSKLDQLQAKYRETATDSDQYGFTGDSAEFLNEFMANRSFRYGLKRDNVSFFKELLQIITQAIKKLLTGAKPRRQFNAELKSLENTIYDLLSKVNKGDIEHYTEDTYKHVVFRQSTSRPSPVSNRSKKLYDKIRKGLENRLKAIKHYSSKNIKSENQLQTLIQNLSNLDAIDGTLEFIDHVDQSIADCINFLNTPFDRINYKQIRQLSDDYIGFYKPLIDEVFSAFVNTDDFKNIPDYNQILETVRNIQSDMAMVDIKFNELLKNKGKQVLVEHLRSTNTPQEFIDRILNWLDDPTNDGNFLTTWLGMSSESTNEVITTIANILTSVMNNTQRKTYEKGIQLVKILDKAKKKYGNDVQKILYELDNNGEYTGFMVRELNYGQMRKDYIAYTDKLANKLGIKKDSEGKFIMPSDIETLNKWLDGINKFYNTHAERRYTSQYYELRNRILSNETRQALDEINSAINEILDYVYEDGVYYENKLTPQMFNKLQQLRRNKKLLSIEYNLDGTEKTGVQLQIARELQRFNKLVYGDKPESKINYKKFREDEAKVIAKYGKDSPEYKYWLARNTTVRLTQEFYDRLDWLSSKGNHQSELYEELRDKRSQILKIYRQNGIINVDELTESDKQMLLQLDTDIANEYTPSQESRSDDEDRFSNFAVINTTEQYDRDYRAASADPTTFDQWFYSNHYEDAKGIMRPASYYTYLWTNDNKYIETVPTGRYSELEALPQFVNKNFDINGPAIQPKKSLYDNSKQYNKIMNSKELKDLYYAVLSTMEEANKLISYFTSTNNYKLPQIEARMLQALSRSNGVLDALGYVFNDTVTTKSDDTDYVDEFLVKPNGQPLKLIPTRYIKMLDNPNNISTDAVGSVIQYYNMALNYSGMSEQQDKIEILLKLLYESTMTTKKGYKGKGSMNYYQQAQALVDRIMYGRKVDPIKLNVAGKEINISKALNNIRNWVSKVNLSFNLNTIGVSFLTDTTYTELEAKLGRFFNRRDLSFAKKKFLEELPIIMANIGNPVPTTITGYLMQLNQVVRDNQEIFSRLDQSAALRAINQHFWYLGYTQSDYTVKSHSLLSIYHSYKLVNNQGFMSRDQYINKFYPNDRKKGEVEFEHLKSITLLDAYEKYKDSFRVKPEYQRFVTQALQDQVKNRIEVITKRIDGTLRDIDKSKIHANSITAYLTQHRNFMINGMHQRFKGRTYNQDLQVVEDGYYPTMYRFLSDIIGNKHFAIKQILQDYDNLDEAEQYAIKKVLYDLALISSSTIVALTVMHIVDGDDDYSNWFTEEMVYLALRSAFEFRSMYNPVELMSLIKSPTAAFSYFENQYSILGIFNPLNYIYGKTPWSEVDRGVYEGWPRILKTIIKTTPFKNILEIQDPKAKRNYLKNQLMSF